MLNIYLKEIFYALTGTVIIFAVLELSWPGIVIAYLNFNLILLLWLTNGIIILVNNNSK